MIWSLIRILRNGWFRYPDSLLIWTVSYGTKVFKLLNLSCKNSCFVWVWSRPAHVQKIYQFWPPCTRGQWLLQLFYEIMWIVQIDSEQWTYHCEKPSSCIIMCYDCKAHFLAMLIFNVEYPGSFLLREDGGFVYASHFWQRTSISFFVAECKWSCVQKNLGNFLQVMFYTRLLFLVTRVKVFF